MTVFDKKMDGKILCAKDVARFLNCSERTAERRMKNDIAGMKNGGVWAAPIDALRDYIKRGANGRLLEMIRKSGY